MRPRVLLLDEPTAGLDPEGVSSLLAHLDDLNAQGIAILLSTHHVGLARTWADEAVIMSGGRILAHENGATIFSNDALLQKARLRLSPRRRANPLDTHA
jgi:cobalt/nickel transport system ATP-binding protein